MRTPDRTGSAQDMPNRRQALKTGAISATAAVSLAQKSSSAADLNSHKASKLLGRRKTTKSIYKQRAVSDYQKNVAEFGGQLATPIQGLLQPQNRGVPWQFDVLVVGSGYGASITAARLSNRMRRGTRLAVLERGKEWIPGKFGDTLKEVTGASRLNLFGRHKRGVSNPTGLYNVLQYEDVTVLSGSGLGGSSLINANVALRPDRDVFHQSCWPAELRDRDFLEPYFCRAEWELGVQREPIDHTYKMRAQRIAAERLSDCGAHFESAALSITRGDVNSHLPILNRQGILQRACIDCGDCLTGCNVGAKNTLAMNYLPLARRAGAELYTQSEVTRIEKCQDHYRVHFLYHTQDEKGEPLCVPTITSARIVVLSAGSIGSTEILMRSQDHSFMFSNRLGRSWTGNGDALGFIRKSKETTGVGGFSAYAPSGNRIGPTIQTNITYPLRPALRNRVLIQEGTAARSYANALGALMRDFDLSNTQVLLGMGHDGAGGYLQLMDDGNAEVQWPGILDSDYRKLIRSEFAKIGQAHGGKYKFLKVFGNRMISVHPLGGCGMADDPNCGVISHRGEVFDFAYGGDIDSATGQNRIHEGLYVSDGAVFPTSIGCNPLLTISAIAERNADLISLNPKYADIFAVNR